VAKQAKPKPGQFPKQTPHPGSKPPVTKAGGKQERVRVKK
jgi:hypothetical protein